MIATKGSTPWCINTGLKQRRPHRSCSRTSAPAMSTENYDPFYPDQPVVDQYLPVWANQHAFGSKPAFIWAGDDAGTSPRTTAFTYSQLNATVERMAESPRDREQGRHCPPARVAGPALRQAHLRVAGLIIPPDASKLGTSGEGEAHRHLLRAVSQARPVAAVADAGYIDTVMNSPASAALKCLRSLSVCRLESSVTTSRAAATDNDAVWMGSGPSKAYLIQYTSGATGTPRPVMVTAGAAAHNVRAAWKAYDLYPSSLVASWVLQYHDCGLMFLLLTFAAGATCVLASPADFKAACTPRPVVRAAACSQTRLLGLQAREDTAAAAPRAPAEPDSRQRADILVVGG
jgi:hypothetical protein